MLVEILKNFPYSLIASIGSVLIAKNLLKETYTHNVKNTLIIILYALVTYYTFNEEYAPLQTIINCLSLTIVIKELFDLKFATSLATSIIVLFILIISELVLMINPILLNNAMVIRTNIIYFTISNFFVILIGYLLSKIKIIVKLTNKFLDKFNSKPKRNELIVLIFLILSVILFCFLVFLNRYSIVNKVPLIIFMIIICIAFYIYIYEKNKYYSLIIKYNNLLEYAYTYEEKLEQDKLIKHEHKNQLAVIKGMSKNKKVINYIDEILKNNKSDDISIKGLNNIPKGGLRGLLYYKLSIMSKKKINYNIDISKNVKKEFNKLPEEDKKTLSYILGVYLDNAIEECDNKKKSIISIEIYIIENNINIVISNTIHNKVNISKIGEKGYSTKGKDHGNGIFLVNKLIEHNKNITVNTKVINQYFIQEIKIKKDVK